MAFLPVDFDAFLDFFGFAFTGDDQGVILQRDFNVLPFHAREFHADVVTILVFMYVQRGRPSLQGRFEQPIQFIL
jgi:hypothetical protein